MEKAGVDRIARQAHSPVLFFGIRGNPVDFWEFPVDIRLELWSNILQF